MKSYTVHRKAELMDDEKLTSEDGLVFVKDGFSWPAFFVPFFWLLWHRMWLVLVVYVGFVCVVALLGYALSLPDNVQFIISMAGNLLLGLEGNNLRRRVLAKRGLHEVADVVADGTEEAVYRFIVARSGPTNGMA